MKNKEQNMSCLSKYKFLPIFLSILIVSFVLPFSGDISSDRNDTVTFYHERVMADTPANVLADRRHCNNNPRNYRLCVKTGLNSPFIYFKNLPKSEVFVVINSKLNIYLPKPFFSQKNGWVIKSKGDKISVSGEEEEHLFYELVVNEINLNRNGKNFSSKTEIVYFLENSDFLEKLGFSETEKKNSLDYFLPKIQSAKDRNYYYLTVLSESAIEKISSLNIKPKPEDLVRQYFALYPTDVPVKTEGDFVFPEMMRNDDNRFLVKETGEILVHSFMLVFWDNKI
tara:strand:- start:658 stop:1506 length:849 start_codon:yes stop_codon:yes gene_type:complete